MHFTRLLLCAAVLLPGAAGANDLIEVYEQALQNDATFKAAAHARDAAIETRPQARAALLPLMNGQYQVGKTETEVTPKECVIDAAGTISSDCPTQSNDSDDSGLSVTLTQPLFNWERFQRWRQAGDEVALAETRYRIAQQNLVLRVAQAYFNVLAGADTLLSANAENKAVERQLEQSRKRFEVGLTAITDVQEAQAKYDLIVAQQLESEQSLSAAREALAEIIGVPVEGNPAPLQDDLPLPAPDPTSVTSWIAAAADGNLALLDSRYLYEISDRGVGVAWARHLPTLDAQAQYFDGVQGGRFSAASVEQTTFRVQVNVPIFSGFAVRSGVRQATALREQREAEYEGQRRLVERQTRDAYQGVISGASRVKALRQAVVSSTTALEASETGLQVGARTTVDVLNSQQQLYFAQRNYYRTRYDYLMSVLRLKAAAGKLSAQDLAEIDRLLVGG